MVGGNDLLSLFASSFYFLTITLLSVTNGMTKPDGKAVLITGCDSGFGHRMANQFNELGYKVYGTVLDTNGTGAQNLKHNATFPDKMIVFALDVTKDQDVHNAFQWVKQELANSGYVLWGLVNNANIASYFPLEWGKLEDYRPMFDVNVYGLVRMSRAFLPLLRISKGRITNMVSFLGRFSVKGLGAYSMTKRAVMSFTDVLRQEVNRFGIKVASIEHSFYKTGMFSVDIQSQQLEQAWNRTSDEIREAYGDSTKELSFLKSLFKTLPMGTNLDIVVDDVIDSIVSSKPKANYRRLDIVNQLIYGIHQYLSTEIVDFIVDLLEKIAPFLGFLS